MADNDNLEYYITFPNPNCDYKNRNENFVYFVKEEYVPVVVLFGWAGAADKNLSVYSRIYEESGLITLRYITPSKYLLYQQSKMPKIGEKLVKLLFDLNFENHPIFVHCFSNGGAFTYQFFLEALKKNIKPIQIKGVVFDSAPGKKRVLSIFRAIKTVRGGNGIFNWIFSMYLTILLCLLGFLKRLIFWKNQIVQTNPFDALINEQTTWPELFIYSKGDILIPFQDVEVFASNRKTLGVDVSLKCYEDTPHVRHYPSNKSSYVITVFKFIYKCLYTAN